jgi:MoaA/NifB/PqqE/SkfB family radical SAM enzyme
MEDSSGEELTIGEIREFFEGERDFLSNVKTIQLTGGEPYLRGDIVDIAEAVWAGIPRAFIWVATNGLLPDVIQRQTGRMLDKSEKGGVGVTVSLDGLEHVHDEQRGVEGAYSRAFETLCRLSKLREEYPAMRLSAGMTVTPHNQHQIKKALMTASYIGADFTLRPINVSETYYRNRKVAGEWETATLAAGLKAVARQSAKSRGPIKAAPVISYLDKVSGYIATGRTSIPCSAATSSFYMNPVGDIYPCLFIGERLGNIRQESIERIWSSPSCKSMRERIKSRRCPSCLVECETMRDIRNDKIGLIAAAVKGLRLSLSS